MNEALTELSIIIVLGIGSIWLASLLRVPSILVLLLAGFLSGPVLGLINPDALLGEVLLPFVSLAVAIILFEGGLSLKLSGIKELKNAVARLVVLGALITWGLSTLAARLFLDLPLSLCLLLGAILIVTGPTVIMPLLRFVRPSGRVGEVARWEAIVNDPIGAIIAVVIFVGIEAAAVESDSGKLMALYLLKSVGVGVLLGSLGAWILATLLRRYWLPDHLQNPVTLMLIIGGFTASNLIAEESGLITVTLMGMILANRKDLRTKHILDFKEELSVVLIAILFITLAGRLELSVMKELTLGTLAFLAVMILVVRPIAVFASTFRSGLSWKEQAFLAWLAPRGIVAAAVTSVFALKLKEHHVEGAEQLVPEIFMLIVGTVAVYGLSAGPVARLLGLAASSNEGVLFIGAHDWAREMALKLKENGIRVILVDTNRENIKEARLQGIPAHYGSILSEQMVEEIDLEGIGRMIALTANDEVNALAALQCVELFGRGNVYHLAPRHEESHPRYQTVPEELRGRLLGGPDISFDFLQDRFAQGHQLKKTGLSEEYDYERFQQESDEAPVLFLLREEKLYLLNQASDPPRPGDEIFSVARPD